MKGAVGNPIELFLISLSVLALFIQLLIWLGGLLLG